MNKKNKEEKIQENNIKCYALTETNNTLPVPILEKSNAKRLIDKHTKDGYVILSACRGFEDFNLDSSDDNDICKHNTINNKRTKELIADIQQRNFSYTPAYGGFIENNGDSNSEEVYEQSVIVYPYKKDNTYNFDELYEFALEMCKKYNQDSVLIKQPNDLPKYVKQDGIVGNRTREKFRAKQYLTGGLADYTGLAWLDGSKSKPELVLNAKDTENFIALKDILSDVLKGGLSRTKNSGDNYYDFHITIEEIANDYDVEKMIQKIKEEINNDARYRNVNAINLLR